MGEISKLKAIWRGEPRITGEGDHVRLVASYRSPESHTYGRLAIRLVAYVGALVILIRHYRPAMPLDWTNNFFLEQLEVVIVGLINAGDRIAAVIQQHTLNVPLESLQGWFYALLWLGGVWLFQASFLFDIYTWLTDRETVTITRDGTRLNVRHGTLSFGKDIPLDDIEGVCITARHLGGYDVQLQHGGGFTRLASINDDEARPQLLKAKIERILNSTTDARN